MLAGRQLHIVQSQLAIRPTTGHQLWPRPRHRQHLQCLTSTCVTCTASAKWLSRLGT